MSKVNRGSLADLARILEEAANPESELREDRKETKPVAPLRPVKKSSTKIIDPKRKAWYEKRLKEQASREAAPVSEEDAPERKEPALPTTTAALAAANRTTPDLKGLLASAQNAKPKTEGGKRPEAWRRKPGDPIF